MSTPFSEPENLHQAYQRVNKGDAAINAYTVKEKGGVRVNVRAQMFDTIFILKAMRPPMNREQFISEMLNLWDSMEVGRGTDLEFTETKGQA